MKKNIFLNDRFLVAGASGMAGSAIHRNLIKNGYGQEKNGGIIFTPSRKELNLLHLDEVQKWFELNRPSVVIIAAAKVGGIFANSSKPTEFLLDNIKIQTNIIETAWKSGVRRLLFLGSSCIYPKFAAQPIEEESLLSGELESTNQWYAIAKISGIKLCEALRKQYNFDTISLMPTNLYGPGDNYHPQYSHVMAALIKKFYTAKKENLPEVTCWGTGNPYREFLHVNDLGDAVIFCLENWDPSSEFAPKDKNGDKILLLNVGSGVEISIKDLANKIANILNYDGNIVWDKSKPDGTPRKKLNTKKINKLGWHAKISLDKGIQETLRNLD